MTQFRQGRVLPTTPFILASPQQAVHYLVEGRCLVCLVRHGQTDWNIVKRLQGRENVPLNADGHLQAAGLSRLIGGTKSKGVSFAEVFTSPLSRAVDTAEYISDALSLGTPVVLDSLIERDYGSLSGLTLAERKELFPGGEKQAGNVETVPAAASRLLRAVDEMIDLTGRCSSVIGVTHGGLINACYSRLTRGEIGTGKTLTVNCSMSCLAAGIGEPIPLAYNLTDDYASNYLARIISGGADI